MADSPNPTSLELDSLFTQRLVRFRCWYFAAIIVLILLPFNGQWRMGLDSSIYRGVAENLVAGKGYVFAGMPQKQIYPGLPFLLATLQKITGNNSVIPVLVVMNVCALLTTWVIYQLILTRYPQWIAIAVTFGVAVNLKFNQQAQEVMTDMPFALGCALAMLGWERLGAAKARAAMVRAVSLLIGGLFLAAVMRPTFWVLALALVITCILNIVRSRERRSIIALAALLIVGLAFAATDPRVRGMNFLHGGYERELLSMAGNLGERIIGNAPKLFNKEISETFFNEPLGYAAIPIAFLLLAGAAIATRREPLWGLQVFILTGIMLILSDVPRYYVMVLPTLWLGYLLILLRLTQWMKPLRRDWTLFALIGFANFMNLYGVGALVYEQHRPDFVQNYRNGAYVPLIQMAAVIKERVPPDANVIGPHASVLAYLSGRNVLSGRSVGFDVAGVTRYPALIAKHNPAYLIGPSRAYHEKDPVMQRIIDKGLIKPTRFVASVVSGNTSLWLTEAQAVVPDNDWRSLPTTRPSVLSDRAIRTNARAALSPEQLARKELRAKHARKELRAARERKAIRAERLLRAATQPASVRKATTRPANQPVTRPASRPSFTGVSLIAPAISSDVWRTFIDRADSIAWHHAFLFPDGTDSRIPPNPH